MPEYTKRYIVMNSAASAERVGSQLNLARAGGARLAVEPAIALKDGRLAVPVYTIKGGDLLGRAKDPQAIIEEHVEFPLTSPTTLDVKTVETHTLQLLERMQFDRELDETPITKNDLMPVSNVKHLDNPLDAFNDLVRLPAVEEFKKLFNVIKLGSNILESKNLIFCGGAGTGKTSAAEALYLALHSAQVLPGKFVRVSGAELMSKYAGNTCHKVVSKFDDAQGGMLFVDEVYSLLSETDSEHHGFGQQALDQLVAEMDRRRGDTMVVIAGYAEELDLLYSKNSGFKGRFLKTVAFEDYDTETLAAIACKFFGSKGFSLDEGARDLLDCLVAKAKVASDFANGRTMRSLADNAVMEACYRMALAGDSPATSKVVIAEDLQRAFDSMELAGAKARHPLGFTA